MRPGLTLLELLVVLAVLAVLAGVTGAAFGRRVPPPGWRDLAAARVAQARAAALARGRPVPFTVVTPDGPARGTALADGSVLGTPSLAVDRLTGRLRTPEAGDAVVRDADVDGR